MHTLSKRLQHEEVKDDELMRDDRGADKKKKLGDGTAMTVTNPPQTEYAVQRQAKVRVIKG